MDERTHGELEAALAALYALPPEQFVAGRDGLVRQLRARGEREAAAMVAVLRRPTLSLWAANWLAREAPEEVRALLGLGAELRDAQRRALAGDRAAGGRAGRARGALPPA